MSNKPRTFLATTALDEFWDKAQPILFLGEWCKPYETKACWEACDSETLLCPLIDQDPDDVCNYTYKIYKAILPEIAQWLNKIHGVNYPLKYWEIVVGSFLFMHVQVTYDRYTRLKKAYSLYPHLTTIGLAETAFFVPLNTINYYQKTTHDDAFNLQIMTQIIFFEFNQKITFKDYRWEIQKKQRKEAIKKAPHRLMTQLKLNLLWFFVRLRGSKTVALMEGNFTKKDLRYLMLSSHFKILPLTQKKLTLPESAELLTVTPNYQLRSEIANLSEIDQFSKLVLKLLVVHMPLSFIENYQKECIISQKCYPHFVKAALGIPATGDESLNLWMAKNSDYGAKRGELQHGGGYGTIKSLSREFWDHQNADFYISWGMKNHKNIIAAPIIPICHEKMLRKNQAQLLSKDSDILWVATEFQKYPCDVQHAMGTNYHETLYYEWQSKVLALLNPDIVLNTVMRLRHTDWGDNWKYIQDQFPHLKLYKPAKKLTFYDHIWTAKLLLFDNLNTTYLYGLAMNIPSILFWSEAIWPIRDDVKFYFDALQKVGIYHTTIESAANMINKVGCNPFLWWNSFEVQSARKQFCDYFAYAPEDWLAEWKNILLKLL